MKKNIVITSIFNPTKAIRKFAQNKDWHLIVVGDKKTPTDWQFENVKYISPNSQDIQYEELSRIIPWNAYSRKNIGYLDAIKNGAEIICDSDDDNIPYANWGNLPHIKEDNLMSGEENKISFYNIYKDFTRIKVWPRGFPLNRINDNPKMKYLVLDKEKYRIGIWQGLADLDPDVDAIYRLTSDKEIVFEKNKKIFLNKGTFCPLNSQNTFFIKELFPLLYLPSTVSFRFTDILRGYIAQIIAWQYNYGVCFFSPSVYQERNPHNYLKDFESELPIYLKSEDIINNIYHSVSPNKTIEDNLIYIYKSLLKDKVVKETEIDILTLWLKYVKN